MDAEAAAAVKAITNLQEQMSTTEMRINIARDLRTYVVDEDILLIFGRAIHDQMEGFYRSHTIYGPGPITRHSIVRFDGEIVFETSDAGEARRWLQDANARLLAYLAYLFLET